MREVSDGYALSPEEQKSVGELAEMLLEVMPPEAAGLTMKRMVAYLPVDGVRRQRVGEEVCRLLLQYKEKSQQVLAALGGRS